MPARPGLRRSALGEAGARGAGPRRAWLALLGALARRSAALGFCSLALGCAPAARPESAAAQRAPAPRAPGALSKAAGGAGEEPHGAVFTPSAASWCRHGGAPLVGEPLLDRGGGVTFVTQDGTVHAYEPDGRFRYSFTVAGTPLGRPTLRAADGALLLGTTARHVYAVSAAGTPLFHATTVAAVRSGLHPLESDSLVYVGFDRHLYALSDRGRALYRVLLPGEPLTEPVVAPGGVVWLGTDRGLVRLERAVRLTRLDAPAPLERVVLFGDGVAVRSGERILGISPTGALRELGQGRWLSSDGVAAIWLDEGGAAHCATPSEAPAPLGSLVVEPSAEPLLLPASLVLPTRRGELWVYARRGCHVDLASRQLLAVASEPLGVPAAASGGRAPEGNQTSEQQRRLVVPTRSGAVCALELPPADAARP